MQGYVTAHARFSFGNLFWLIGGVRRRSGVPNLKPKPFRTLDPTEVSLTVSCFVAKHAEKDYNNYR